MSLEQEVVLLKAVVPRAVAAWRCLDTRRSHPAIAQVLPHADACSASRSLCGAFSLRFCSWLPGLSPGARDSKALCLQRAQCQPWSASNPSRPVQKGLLSDTRRPAWCGRKSAQESLPQACTQIPSGAHCKCAELSVLLRVTRTASPLGDGQKRHYMHACHRVSQICQSPTMTC